MTLRLSVLALCTWGCMTVLAYSQAEVDRTPRFDPTEYFDSGQQVKLRSGLPVASVIKSHGNEIALAAAARTDITPERLVKWGRRLDLMHAGAFTPAAGRFSTPARLDDLAALTFNKEDLDDLRRCQPGSCGVKLAVSEIALVRSAVDAPGKEWRSAAGDAYRRVLLARAAAFQTDGYAGALPYHDHRKPVSPADEFARVLAGPEQRAASHVQVEEHLRASPRAPGAELESFLLWSKNVTSGAREVVSLTHVAIHGAGDADPGATLISAQIYASHYLNASLSYTVLVTNERERYLVYLRRTRVDVVHGPFGGIIRGIIERRIRAEAPKLLDEVRRRVERGDPLQEMPAAR